MDQPETKQAKQTNPTSNVNTSNKQKQKVDDAYLRLLAEFENFKKRTEQQQQYWLTHIKKDLCTSLLPVLDDFDLALKHKNKQSASDNQQGLALIYKKLIQLLTKQGLQPIKTNIGDTFDPKKHEALSTIPGNKATPKNTIADVIHPGYLLDHQLIRFAKVIVHA